MVTPRTAQFTTARSFPLDRATAARWALVSCALRWEQKSRPVAKLNSAIVEPSHPNIISDKVSPLGDSRPLSVEDASLKNEIKPFMPSDHLS